MGLRSVVMKVKGASFFKKKKKVILSWGEGFRGERVWPHWGEIVARSLDLDGTPVLELPNLPASPALATPGREHLVPMQKNGDGRGYHSTTLVQEKG
ncbi:small subunit ribosomal protein [Panicum miliaceum]|uniref:Small subunit ribosomal protein n=1 Tax=Panicum miliaceum TaxID=4540 RepID=A0A3L6R9L5_PANMI|nr:small subunit ribosomal protein [Panicum miliaceum]